MVVVNIDTEHLIEYVTLTNDLKLHDEDREMTLRIEITDIATEVSGKDENFGRGYCLN